MQEFKVSNLLKIVCAACLLAGLSSFSLGQSKEASSVMAVNGSLKYGIVVDNSGSMRLQFESVIELVKSIVGENQPDDETFLVRFASPDKVVLLEELTSVKAAIQDTADEMFIEGGRTAVLDAVSFSAKYLEDKAGTNAEAKVLLVITDGDERGSSARIDEVLAQLKRSNIRIFAIGISDLKVETKTLDKLTKGTGGKLFLPKGPIERSSSVKTIAAAIRVK